MTHLRIHGSYSVRYIIFFILILSCKDNSYNANQDLRRLDYEELFEYYKRKIYINEFTILTDNTGTIISKELLSNYPPEEYFADYYVDKMGRVVKAVYRPSTKADLQFIKRVNEQILNSLQLLPIHVDCRNTDSLALQTLASDQKMRKHSGYDREAEIVNISTIAAILEDCDLHSTQLTKEGMQGIFVVLQHAPLEIRKKYESIILLMFDDGRLDSRLYPLWKDRLLMDEGFPQVYGTQVIKDRKTGEWTLYALQNEVCVDQRRSIYNLGPLSDYLFDKWSISFGIEQSEKCN